LSELSRPGVTPASAVTVVANWRRRGLAGCCLAPWSLFSHTMPATNPRKRRRRGASSARRKRRPGAVRGGPGRTTPGREIVPAVIARFTSWAATMSTISAGPASPTAPTAVGTAFTAPTTASAAGRTSGGKGGWCSAGCAARASPRGGRMPGRVRQPAGRRRTASVSALQIADKRTTCSLSSHL
jgi:hypothetical protein